MNWPSVFRGVGWFLGLALFFSSLAWWWLLAQFTCFHASSYCQPDFFKTDVIIPGFLPVLISTFFLIILFFTIPDPGGSSNE